MTEKPTTPGQIRRINWLVSVLVMLAALLTARLASWQLIPRGDLINLSLSGDRAPNVISAVRGNILDSQGHYLASSTTEYSVAVSPILLSDNLRKELTPTLASILDMDQRDVSEVLESRDTRYVVLGTNLPASVGKQVEDLDLDAFAVDVRFRRVYPDDSLAAHVLGFVDYEGNGQYGLERYYDPTLSGTDGSWSGLRDAWGNEILMTLGGYRSAEDGADLVLTIDRNVQARTESILREAIARQKASAGNIIVMDVRTGAVIAMANYPSYEPAQYWHVDSMDQFINTSVSAIYEPGSVFKPLTLASALDAHVIRSDSTYDDRGEIIVGNQTIWNSDRAAHGVTTMTELLAYSLNVGAAHVATVLGPTRFYETIRRFGFGEFTGVDLGLEEAGIMRVPGNSYWHMSDLGTNSFGQGISVTPLQMAAAYGAIANNGVLMQPYTVSEVRYADRVERHRPFRVRQVVSEETAQTITRLLVDAVKLGMDKAALSGYQLAGKSGTSGIPGREGYTGTDTIASFVGFGPVPNPRFVVLVKLDRPREGYWGLEVAAPEFRRMAKMLFDYYGILPSS